MGRKILLFIFSILVLIIIGETGLYIYYSVPKENSSSNKKAITPTSNTDNNIDVFKRIKLLVNKDTLSDARLSYSIEAKVIEINNKGTTTSNVLYVEGVSNPPPDRKKEAYAIKLTLLGTGKLNRNKHYEFYYKPNKIDIYKYKFVTLVNGVEQIINPSDFKLNDKIIIKVSFDLALKNKTTDLQEMKLIKL